MSNLAANAEVKHRAITKKKGIDRVNILTIKDECFNLCVEVTMVASVYSFHTNTSSYILIDFNVLSYRGFI